MKSIVVLLALSSLSQVALANSFSKTISVNDTSGVVVRMKYFLFSDYYRYMGDLEAGNSMIDVYDRAFLLFNISSISNLSGLTITSAKVHFACNATNNDSTNNIIFRHLYTNLVSNNEENWGLLLQGEQISNFEIKTSESLDISNDILKTALAASIDDDYTTNDYLYLSLINANETEDYTFFKKDEMYLYVTYTIDTPSPKNLTVSNITSNTLNLSWSEPDEKVIRYYVYKNGIKIGETTNTYLTFSGLSPNSWYNLGVVADYGEYGLSDMATISVLTKPGAPTNLVANPACTGGTLEWDAPSGLGTIIKYKIYQGGAYIDYTTSTTYTIEGLNLNTTYSFQVAAVNTTGESVKSSAVSITTGHIPEPPTNASVHNWGPAVVVAWTPSISSDVTSYNIYQRLPSNTIRLDTLVNGRSFFLGLLSSFTASVYIYSIRAYNGGCYSEWDSFGFSPLGFKSSQLYLDDSISWLKSKYNINEFYMLSESELNETLPIESFTNEVFSGYKAKIYDKMGRLVIDFTKNSNSDVNNLKRDLYIIKLQQDDQFITKKVYLGLE